MDPLTALVAAYLISWLVFPKVREVSKGLVTAVTDRVKAATGWGGAGHPKAAPRGGGGGDPKPSPKTPAAPVKAAAAGAGGGHPKIPSPATAKGSGGDSKKDTPESISKSIRQVTARDPGRGPRPLFLPRPRDPDKPPFGVPVKTTRTTVTTIREPAPRDTTRQAPPDLIHEPNPTPKGTPVTDTTMGASVSESIPEHMDASDRLAGAITDLADTVKRLVQESSQHTESAETLGMNGPVLGGHSDTTDSMRRAADALEAAADQATATAALERQTLTPVVEAASSAPLTDQPTVGQLRQQ